MFTKTDLYFDKKKYIQLTAADITQQWKMTEQLQRQNDQLKRRSEELKETIDNLYILSHESELEKAKMRAHDVLGEWLTLLLRTVRSKQDLDYELLRTLSLGLIDELNAGRRQQNYPSSQDELDSLRNVFDSIGVKIMIDGKLPEDEEKGRLFVSIIREGITNAVRHGFATQIFVHIDRISSSFNLRIIDNGYQPVDSITEGNGLSGMRKKLALYAGVLTVTTNPRFSLNIHLPAGDYHV
jgi:nitrate/nitrite-specific signal transduction histidine kinase